MTTLSDRHILERINGGGLIVAPYDRRNLQAASYDFHLGRGFQAMRRKSTGFHIDPVHPDLDLWETVGEHQYLMRRGQLVLGVAEEYLSIPEDMAVEIHGRSSLGRQGLLIHVTAGFCDPGWRGYATLELFNASAYPILLTSGMDIGQFVFRQLTAAADRPYGHLELHSRYQDQGATPEPARRKE